MDINSIQTELDKHSVGYLNVGTQLIREAAESLSIFSSSQKMLIENFQRQMSFIESIRLPSSTIELLKDRSLLEPISKMSHALAADIHRIHGFAETVSQFAELDRSWRQQLDVFKDIGQGFKSITAITDLHSATLGEVARTSSRIMSGLSFDGIGGTWGLMQVDRSGLLSALKETCNGVASVAESFKELRIDALSVPPILSRYPTFTLFQTTDISRGFLEDAGVTPVDDYKQHTREVVKSEPDAVEAIISDLTPALIPLYREAQSAFLSKKEGYVRHFCVASRELLTHLMHVLAPDEAIKNWTLSSYDYHDNRPTRKARLRYIMRSAVSEEMSKFVDLDIRTAIELMDILNNYTHRVTVEATESQLSLIKMKVESIVHTLIIVGMSAEA